MTNFNTLASIALAVFVVSMLLNLFTFVYVVTVCEGKQHCEVLGFEIERKLK